MPFTKIFVSGLPLFFNIHPIFHIGDSIQTTVIWPWFLIKVTSFFYPFFFTYFFPRCFRMLLMLWDAIELTGHNIMDRDFYSFSARSPCPCRRALLRLCLSPCPCGPASPCPCRRSRRPSVPRVRADERSVFAFPRVHAS